MTQEMQFKKIIAQYCDVKPEEMTNNVSVVIDIFLQIPDTVLCLCSQIQMRFFPVIPLESLMPLHNKLDDLLIIPYLLSVV